MVVGDHPAPDARLLRADPHDDPPRHAAAAGVVPALPRGGEGPSVAPGRALGQGPRTGHHRNRGRVLGRRRTDHPVTPTGRPGGGGGHPPRPAHRWGTHPAGGRRPRPGRPARRVRSTSRTTRPAPTGSVARSCRCPRAPACPHRPPIPPQPAPTARTARAERVTHPDPQEPGTRRDRSQSDPAARTPANRPSRGSAGSTSATTSDDPPLADHDEGRTRTPTAPPRLVRVPFAALHTRRTPRHITLNPENPMNLRRRRHRRPTPLRTARSTTRSRSGSTRTATRGRHPDVPQPARRRRTRLRQVLAC